MVPNIIATKSLQTNGHMKTYVPNFSSNNLCREANFCDDIYIYIYIYIIKFEKGS
jgi:hypothetical protein